MEPRLFISGKLDHPEVYREAVAGSGMEPVHLLREDGSFPAVRAEEYGALLVPGGGDVHPRFYGEEKQPQCGEADEGLDRWELDLVRQFLSAGKPVFGICRGCQLVNVALGGTLVQHLQSEVQHRLQPEGYAVHPTTAVPDGFVAKIYGKTDIVTNSWHHQCVKELAPGFRAVQFAADGIIEAIEHETLPVWCVQWHPERLSFSNRREDADDGAPVFAFFREMILKR